MKANTTYLYKNENLSRDEIEKRNNGVLLGYRTKRVLPIEKMLEGKDILDVGCGYGEYSRVIAEKGYNVHGIDRVESFVTIAKEFNTIPNTTFEKRDLFGSPFPDNSFDGIVFFETIEHVDNPVDFLKEFERILRPGGFVIISTPNSTSLKNIVFSLSHRKQKKRNEIIKQIGSEKKFTGSQLEHIYNWNFITFTRLLDRCGFDVVDHAFSGVGPISFRLFGKKFKWFRGDPKIFNGFQTLKKTQILKCRKRSSESIP